MDEEYELQKMLEYHMQREQHLEHIIVNLGEVLEGMFACMPDDLQQLPHIVSFRERFKKLKQVL